MVVVACVALAVVALVFPARATTLMDEGAKAVSSAAQAGFSPRASDLITRESIYNTWLVGNFGSADSPTATEYGPRLMSALTYTWSDVKAIEADPDVQEKIDKAKAAEFKKIADEVEEKDPAAYESFTGKTDTRTAGTILGVVWVLIMGFFVVLASLLTLVARLIMIALVVVAPIGVVVGVVKYPVLQRMWDLFTAALVNIVKFTIAAGVMTLVLGAHPDRTGGHGLAAAVRDHRHRDRDHDHQAGPVVQVHGGSRPEPCLPQLAAASSRRNRGRRGRREQADPARRRRPGRDGQLSGHGAGRVRGHLHRAAGRAVHAPAALAAGRADRGVRHGRRDRLGRGGAAGRGRSPTGPGGQPAHHPGPDPDQSQRPATGVRGRRSVSGPGTGAAGHRRADRRRGRRPAAGGRRADGPAPARGRAGAGRVRVGPGGQQHRGGTGGAGAAAHGRRRGRPVGRPSVTQGARSDPPPVVGTGEPTVVYPTGIVVQNEPGVYRSGGQFKVDEYVRFPEPQVDANGEETWTPLYRAKAKVR